MTPEAQAAERERYRAMADAAMAHVLAGPPLAACKPLAVADAAGDLHALRARIEQLITWCDERREAGDGTTLGMVQQKLRALLDA